jgi:HNH endonuclease
MKYCKDHPRGQGKRRSYVFEHILVMEAHIGRHLHKDENVHHINGVKDDNSLQNLELWTRPQPSGIRAKEALAWARLIIDRYTDIEDKI